MAGDGGGGGAGSAQKTNAGGPRKTCGILAFVLVTPRGVSGRSRAGCRVSRNIRSCVEWCLQQELGLMQERGIGVMETMLLRDSDGVGADGRG